MKQELDDCITIVKQIMTHVENRIKDMQNYEEMIDASQVCRGCIPLEMNVIDIIAKIVGCIEKSEDENLEDMMNDLRKDKLRHMSLQSLHGTESTQNSPT